MRILITIDEGKQSTFFYLIFEKNVRKLLVFTPDILLEGKTIGDWFVSESLPVFLDKMARSWHLTIDQSVIIKQTDLVDLLFQFSAGDAAVLVTNPKAFALTANPEIIFKKGQQSLNKAQLTQFITYQIDSDGEIGVIQRQLHVFRLLKQAALHKRSLLEMQHVLPVILKRIKTGLSYKAIFSLGRTYIFSGKKTTEKLILSGNEPLKKSQEKIAQFLHAE